MLLSIFRKELMLTEADLQIELRWKKNDSCDAIERKKNEIERANFLFKNFDPRRLQWEVLLEENDFVNVRKVMDVNDISAKKCIYKKTTTM